MVEVIVEYKIQRNLAETKRGNLEGATPCMELLPL